MFKKSKNVCIAALAVFTLNAGNQAFATCSDLIWKEAFQGKYKPSDEGHLFQGSGLVAVGISTAGAGGGVIAGGAVAGAGLLLSTFGEGRTLKGMSYSSTEDLNKRQDYAYKVLDKSGAKVNNVSPILASFIKSVKREISNDRSAIIPTDGEILRALDVVNHDLSACLDEYNDFYIPEKTDLVKTVVAYLSY